MLKYQISFGELTRKYLDFINGRDIGLTRAYNISRLGLLHSSWKANARNHYGGTPDMVAAWIRQGYVIPGLQLVPELAPVRKRKRMFMTDLDGDFQYDLWKSGEDLFFVDFTKREATPSMDFRMVMNFSAIVHGETVVQYEAWLLKAITALEKSGIDCGISVGTVADTITKRRESMDIDIIVKRSGEALDITLWSAMFSPGAFRHLVFLAMILGCDHHDRDVMSNLGIPPRGEFSCKFEADKRRIVANSYARAGRGDFHEEDMTAQFRAALHEAQTAIN